MANIVDRVEDGTIEIGTVALIVAVVVVVVISVKGLKGFFAWLESAWKKLFGEGLPEWLKPGALADWLARISAKMDMDAPLGNLLYRWSSNLDGVSGRNDGRPDVDVQTGTNVGVGNAPQSDNPAGGGTTDDDDTDGGQE